jgi:Leucine-rich repeat (LRR) protein
LLIGGGLGWIVHQARVQRDAVAAIESAGGRVVYDWQLNNGRLNPIGQPWAPKPLVDACGVDYFGRAVRVRWDPYRPGFYEGVACVKDLSQIQKLDLSGTIATDEEVAHLRGLTELRRLDLSLTHITPESLAHLERLRNLEFLSLMNTSVADTGLIHLKGLTNLQVLSLDSTDVTDAGLAHLAGLLKLRELSLARTEITDAAIRHLSGLTNLRRLWLGRKVSEGGMRKLKQVLRQTDMNPKGDTILRIRYRFP